MLRSLRGATLLLLTSLSLTACASKPSPVITSVQAAPPPLLPAELEQHRCPPRRKPSDAITPDMDARVALRISNTYAKLLAKDYDNCLILEDGLISMETRPVGAPAQK